MFCSILPIPVPKSDDSTNKWDAGTRGGAEAGLVPLFRTIACLRMRLCRIIKDVGESPEV